MIIKALWFIIKVSGAEARVRRGVRPGQTDPHERRKLGRSCAKNRESLGLRIAGKVVHRT